MNSKLERMNQYHIYTDGGSRELDAVNVSEALSIWGEAPKSVTTAREFEAWLEKCGGFGGIQENGVKIANVRA